MATQFSIIIKELYLSISSISLIPTFSVLLWLLMVVKRKLYILVYGFNKESYQKLYVCGKSGANKREEEKWFHWH